MDSLKSIFEKGYQRLFQSTGAHLVHIREGIEPITGPLPEKGITLKNNTLIITVPASDASGLFLRKEQIKKAAQEAAPSLPITHIQFITR